MTPLMGLLLIEVGGPRMSGSHETKLRYWTTDFSCWQLWGPPTVVVPRLKLWWLPAWGTSRAWRITEARLAWTRPMRRLGTYRSSKMLLRPSLSTSWCSGSSRMRPPQDCRVQRSARDGQSGQVLVLGRSSIFGVGNGWTAPRCSSGMTSPIRSGGSVLIDNWPWLSLVAVRLVHNGSTSTATRVSSAPLLPTGCGSGSWKATSKLDLRCG